MNVRFFNLLADFLSESVLSGRVRTKWISISIWNLSGFKAKIVKIHHFRISLHYYCCMVTRIFCYFYLFVFFYCPSSTFMVNGYRSGRKFMLKFPVIAYSIITHNLVSFNYNFYKVISCWNSKNEHSMAKANLNEFEKLVPNTKSTNLHT